ncbi:ribosome assembly factor SBDS [Candidatus Woesearchaeota archaeon]|nr:ribosome assembly factor SBDS [Candidatus Woesearchaeota archaeon]
MVEHGRQKIFEKERIHWNTAWMKTHGEHFEVVINPDEALDFKKSSGAKPEIRECLRSEEIWANAKKGELASEEAVKMVFETDDPLKVATRLILEGEIQLSADHRADLREQKKNKILDHINAYAIDPKTGNPHPRQRIELAMDEAKVKIDYNKDVESQIQDIVKHLQPIIPIRLEMVTLQVHLSSQYGQKLYGELSRWGTLKRTDWLNDGGLLAYVEIPAGMQNDFIDDLAKRTHGGVEVKKVDEKTLRE